MNRHLVAAIFLGTTMISAMAPVGEGAWAQSTASRSLHLSSRELEALTAPIALYPDQLLADVLMAATYPTEITAAVRWLADPGNGSLRGEDLEDAIDRQYWDPSIKALVTVPGLLQMLDARIDWTERLGDAFKVQSEDVMDAIQHLRRQAYLSGKLRTNGKIRVTYVNQLVTIEPAEAGMVYFPVYEPAEVFGEWRYPEYPPIVLTPPPTYGLSVGYSYGIVVPVFTPYWGWHRWDWHRHRIHIDPYRYNHFNRHWRHHRGSHFGTTWRHDSHRDRPWRDTPGRNGGGGHHRGGPGDLDPGHRGGDHHPPGGWRGRNYPPPTAVPPNPVNAGTNPDGPPRRRGWTPGNTTPPVAITDPTLTPAQPLPPRNDPPRWNRPPNDNGDFNDGDLARRPDDDGGNRTIWRGRVPVTAPPAVIPVAPPAQIAVPATAYVPPPAPPAITNFGGGGGGFRGAPQMPPPSYTPPAPVQQFQAPPMQAPPPAAIPGGNADGGGGRTYLRRGGGKWEREN